MPGGGAAARSILGGIGGLLTGIGHRREAQSARKQANADTKAHQDSNIARLNLLRAILESYGYSGLLTDKAIANMSTVPHPTPNVPSMFSTLGGMASGVAGALPIGPVPTTPTGAATATGAVGQESADTASRDWWDDWEKQFGSGGGGL